MTTTPTEPTFLVDHFLIAMPQLRDSYFANTVVYLWQHSPEGALGLVINLPTNMQLADILDQLNIEDLRDPAANQIVLSGGPVETEKGFILHDAQPRWPSSMRISDGITLTTSRDILTSIGRGEGPANYLMTLGCSGWGAGQLEKELAQNSWFTCPATKSILFSTDFANKANMAAATLGFSMAQLTTDVGYS
jgi:putative transcriptional regulator